MRGKIHMWRRTLMVGSLFLLPVVVWGLWAGWFGLNASSWTSTVDVDASVVSSMGAPAQEGENRTTDYLDGTVTFKNGDTAPVLKLGNPARALGNLQQKTGINITLLDPRVVGSDLPSLTYNCVAGRSLMVKELRRIKGTGRAMSDKLTRVVDFAAEFEPEAVVKNGGIPLATRVLSTEPPTGAFDGMYVAYYFNVKDGRVEESIKWIDTTLLASQDILGLMWIRELAHALFVRDLVRRHGNSWEKVRVLMREDAGVQKEFVTESNQVLVEAYHLFMKVGVLQRTTERLPVDINVWNQVAKMQGEK